MSWRTRLLQTHSDPAALVARVLLGIVIFPHGAQKAFGWFGGGGFEATMGAFGSMGIPAPLALLAILAEFPGSLALVLGCLTRVAAFGVLCNMAVAALLVSRPHGFFMNWYGTQQGEGYEFHLLAIGLALVALIRGGGKWSVDGVLAR
ncbi:MAG: DoxX family protein [Gemmatimonadales bacterium]